MTPDLNDRHTFLISYAYPPDMVERRAPHRDDHLAYLRAEHAASRLLIAGALSDPVDGGFLVLVAATPSDAITWVSADPYAKAGLLRGITVREVTLVSTPTP